MTPTEAGQRLTLTEIRELLEIYAIENEEFEAAKAKK